MHRIILKSPFLQHYAGSVCDLELSTRGENEKESVYECILPEKSFFLPDGGKGYPAELPAYETLICPPQVFANINLCTEPCRLTAIQSQPTFGNEPALDIEQVVLSVDKQGVLINIPPSSPIPGHLKIWDRRSNSLLQECVVDTYSFDLSFARHLW